VAEQRSATRRPPDGLKPKDLCGIPWRVAFALQDDGWWLRSDIIWAKPNPMPESVTDRPTKAHEYLFLLAKSERYFYDAEAVAEPAAEPERERADRFGGANGHTVRHGLGSISTGHVTRNKRTVWTIPTNPYGGAHFATFPSALVEPCIHAGCPEGGIVLDPFGGSGVVAATAFRLGRRFVHVDLKYHELARERIPPMAFLPGIQSPTEEVLTR
jgi:DNA modification methylase